MRSKTGWPFLPKGNGEVDIPAQVSPYYGERTIRVYIFYPGKSLQSVNESSGLFLSLHNWGGVKAVGAPNPEVLASRYNIVAISVDYLQSGAASPPKDGHPYDCGYLQALDVLRALYYVYNGLNEQSVRFNKQRIYATGGSGGGNVTLMANKLAPRTFACIVDISGLAYLTDDVAFGLGGNGISAGYSKNPESPNYLPKHAQQIRDPGNSEHMALMKTLNNSCKVVVCHGVNDKSCLVSDKKRVVDNMKTGGMDVDVHYIAGEDIDGKIIKSTDHSIGDRTALLIHFAEKYLSSDSKDMKKRNIPCDFELKDEKVTYRTNGGYYLISYKDGYPVGSFVPSKN